MVVLQHLGLRATESVHLDFVQVPLLRERLVMDEPVRDHGGARLHALLHELEQDRLDHVVDVPEPAPTRPRPNLSGHGVRPFPNLNRPNDLVLAFGLAPVRLPGLRAADGGLVHLHAAGEFFPLRVDHRRPKFVEHLEGDLVPLEPEGPLELPGREAALVRDEKIGREEPEGEGLSGVLHDRPGRGALDVLAVGADDDEAILRGVELGAAAGGAGPVALPRPTGLEDEVEASPLIPENPEELGQGAGEVGARHSPGSLLPAGRCSQPDTQVVQ